MRRALGLLLLLALAGAGAAAWIAWRQVAAFRAAPFGSAEEKVVVVPPGASGRAVVRALAGAGVVADERLGWWTVRWLRRDPRPFRAGEYAFQGPLRPDEVLERIHRGEVKLHRFTVPEGLRADEIAQVVERSGLARANEFLAVVRDPEAARALGSPFPGLEGLLYPDTYAFARGVGPAAIAEAMVRRYREEWARADAERKSGVALSEAEAVVLASIIEKETGRPDERARISCVFHNRLRMGMRLQTDPTVLYAKMLRTGAWSRNITRQDLAVPHPYNTYTTAGLPPGPIASPGAAALRAAVAPEECGDLYFVSRNDGSHVFCPDLACHAAAVRTHQVEFFRARRRGAGGSR
ncbi:MAG TPA: endolytic transglycosylase MltG [Anaeromyxobacteraceae bacterium]|nr:endolytic transglycosylase MltG [Anaeromyxobacteraceae bacterium]